MANIGAMVATHAAAAAGLTGDALVIAVAIAGAESNWNFNAVGDVDLPSKGCRSYGAWQINSCPERDASSTTRYGASPEDLFDPLINARSMAAISSGGTNWAPWTVWKTGKYRDYIGEARKSVEKLDPKVVAQWAALGRLSDKGKSGGKFGFSIGTPFGDLTSESGPTGVLADAVNATLDPLAAVAQFFGALLKAETWLRVLGFIIGAALVWYGVQFIIGDQAIGALK